MFCLQFYNKSSVMQLAIPAVVKLLDCENRDLCRSVSSYLSLAAIDNADLLAEHTEIIVISVSNGKEKCRSSYWLIQTRKRLHKNAVYWDKTQPAHFRGNPLCQATKQHLNNS